MGPREIMMEHIRFWASEECTPLSSSDLQLIQKLADVMGVKLRARTQLEIVEEGT